MGLSQRSAAVIILEKKERGEAGRSVLQGEFIVTDASWKERSKRYRVHQVISGAKGWRE